MEQHHDEDDHIDGGLAIDIPKMLDRRNALRLIGGIGLLTFIGCGSGDDTDALATGSPAAATEQPGGTDTSGTCTEIPEETGGPFPADGTNGPNVLTESGVVRTDITKSFGSLSGTAEGVPLAVRLKIVSLANDCKPYAGAAVYAWHCDRDGLYSLYSPGAENQNYLRGVQAADADGDLTFTSIFPGAYAGRWPHIHFEVYPDLDAAAAASGKLATSQLALPEDTCKLAYASAGYEQSVGNLAQTSLDSDGVFSDGYSAQMAKMSGSNSSGWTATLTVAV